MDLVQDAKARLSEVIKSAKKNGPQTITQRGVKSAVVLPFEEWERSQQPNKPTLLEILRSGPEGDLPIPPPPQQLENAQAGEALKFLLDTNVLSEIRKSRPHGGVLAWFTAHNSAYFVTPVIALFELQMGVEKLRTQDPYRAAQFEYWIARLEAGVHVLPLNAAASRETARMLHKQPMIIIADAMIAAIAKVNGLTLATRNTRDFERFRVPLVNPFTYRG